MDKEFCKEQAKTIRALAEQADPFIKRRLLDLARHYERRMSFDVIANDEKAVAPERHSDSGQVIQKGS